MKNKDVVISTLPELFAAVENGQLVYSHSSFFSGYVSRRGDGEVSPYSGRFGVGYTWRYNNGSSTRYSVVRYYLFPGKKKK